MRLVVVAGLFCVPSTRCFTAVFGRVASIHRRSTARTECHILVALLLIRHSVYYNTCSGRASRLHFWSLQFTWNAGIRMYWRCVRVCVCCWSSRPTVFTWLLVCIVPRNRSLTASSVSVRVHNRLHSIYTGTIFFCFVCMYGISCLCVAFSCMGSPA